MDTLIPLYQELQDQGVRFFTWDLERGRAVTMEMGGEYAVFMDFDNIHSLAEERTVLAHEGGHICTGATHKVSSPYDLIEKHEYKAWKWALLKLLPREALAGAIREGVTEPWELAERFDVTEEMVRMALCWYTQGNLNLEERGGNCG